MSELSGYEPASPLVAFRNVFPSRCDNFRILRQFFAHIQDSECFHRVELFLLVHDGFDDLFINTFRILVEKEVIFHREFARNLFCINCCQSFNLSELASLFVLIWKFCCARITLDTGAHGLFGLVH